MVAPSAVGSFDGYRWSPADSAELLISIPEILLNVSRRVDIPVFAVDATDEPFYRGPDNHGVEFGDQNVVDRKMGRACDVSYDTVMRW